MTWLVIVWRQANVDRLFFFQIQIRSNSILLVRFGLLHGCQQGITGLDCWIAQSGLLSNLVDWIVIDNPKSKLDFGFGLSIQFSCFNPNPKKIKLCFIK
jgi:hypothetical protein